MIYALFALALAASAYSLWKARQTHCDQRSANLVLGLIMPIIAVLMALGINNAVLILSLIAVLYAGIAILGERGFYRLIPAYLLGFSLYLMIGMVNQASGL